MEQTVRSLSAFVSFRRFSGGAEGVTAAGGAGGPRRVVRAFVGVSTNLGDAGGVDCSLTKLSSILFSLDAVL